MLELILFTIQFIASLLFFYLIAMFLKFNKKQVMQLLNIKIILGALLLYASMFVIGLL